MNTLRTVFFKIIGLIPTKVIVYNIKAILWGKSENLKPDEALQFLFEVEKDLYYLEGRNALRYGNGVHPKHRMTNYHRFFIDNIESGAMVLDIGCGNGALAYDVSKSVEGVKLVAIDLSEINIEIARKSFSAPNIDFIVGNAAKNLPSRNFDVVILSNVLEHIEKRVELLINIKAKCKPRKLLIRVPMFDRDWRVPLKKEVGVDYRLDETHFIEYTFSEFKKEISAGGFKVRDYKINWGEIWAVVVSDAMQ
jgi:ubiquinone/menaquinone biosynthesis C-methylase UbiE